jgi:hypothetical protein
VRRLHADLVFCSWTGEQTKAAVLSRRMVDEEREGQKALGGDMMGECFPSSHTLRAFMTF